MSVVVISQPMLFPWVGMLEQVRMADVFVHYDDVDFSKGSFVNRVQVKSTQGSQWLTIPVANRRLGQPINELQIDKRQPWQTAHRNQLIACYKAAPFCDDMLEVVERVYARSSDQLAALVIAGLEACAEYFEIANETTFVRSSQLGITGTSTQRVIDIVTKLHGRTYVTGHGAKNYLDHAACEQSGVDVRYIDYAMLPYPQQHGAFNPYVSCLDLIANCGRDGRRLLFDSPTIPWREFIGRFQRQEEVA